MSFKHGLALAAIAALTIPAFAQSADPGEPRTPLPYDRGYDKPSPRTDAINAPNRAKRADLNASVAARSGVTYTIDPADLAAYEAAIRAHDDALIENEIRYQRQQRAYADAMAAWRFDVAACRSLARTICDVPSPIIADFY